MAYEDRSKKFEQYLASMEPGVEECASNWSMAFCLNRRKLISKVRFRAKIMDLQ